MLNYSVKNNRIMMELKNIMLKTLNWYIAKNFLITFIAAIGVLTFGMTGARLVKVFD